MTGRTLNRLAAGVIVVALMVAGCGKKRVETDADRDRTEPPVVQDTNENDQPVDEGPSLDEVRSSIGEMIFFNFDSSDLREDARATLQRKSDLLRQFPEVSVRIEGHADERGTIEYNLALGERRAESARRYLIDLGIDPDRLSTVSYGEERPLVEGNNEAAWAENRRDEFIASMN